MKKEQITSVIPIERIERQIYLIRGQKVMLDSDMAKLYQVQTFNLNKAVKRNRDRFPEDFMFQLTRQEFDSLKSQTAMSDLRFQIGMSSLRSRIVTPSYGGRRYLPYAFTEHGVAMLSSVLNSKRAVQMNILVIRAFVKLREMLLMSKDLSLRLEKLEATQKRHTSVITLLADEIDKMRNLPPEPPKEPIGFGPR